MCLSGRLSLIHIYQLMALPERSRIQLLAPVVRGRKGEHVKLLDQARRSGFVRVRIDGSLYELTEEIKLDKNIKHNIEIVVDRLIVKPGIEKRLADSMETVLDLANGLAFAEVQRAKTAQEQELQNQNIQGGTAPDGTGTQESAEPEILRFSQSFSCPDCGISIDEVEPRSFSFNNPDVYKRQM